jgi:hypothetical protein
VIDPVIRRVDDDAEAIEGNGQLDEADAFFLGLFDLLALDRARGVVDVRLAYGELLESATGATHADRDPDARELGVELFGDRFTYGVDRAGAVDADIALHLLVGKGFAQGSKGHGQESDRNKNSFHRSGSSCAAARGWRAVGSLDLFRRI